MRKDDDFCREMSLIHTITNTIRLLELLLPAVTKVCRTGAVLHSEAGDDSEQSC